MKSIVKKLLLFLSFGVIVPFVFIFRTNIFIPLITVGVVLVFDCLVYLIVRVSGKKSSFFHIHIFASCSLAVLMLITGIILEKGFADTNDETLKTVSGVILWYILPAIILSSAIGYIIWYFSVENVPVDKKNEKEQ